eukprot:TRINITY_DN50947_c0_g1_i1.p1 TRINITY_DN50947_c0_g1~~TRINITY_DN50947_c0_g1_i1.p1  ORF type:complete len:333 (+),score=51.24 TRINITY_DN50947_c0_g1_i1:110-1108(+)
MTSITSAIQTTRGVLSNAESVEEWVTTKPEAARRLHGCSLAYFNGAFSPPTRSHAHIAQAVVETEGVDALWMDPEPSRPQKLRWLDEIFEERVQMCECMFEELGISEKAGVGSLRKDLGPVLGASPELFRTLRNVLGGPKCGRIYWVMGADVLEGMRFWSEKARECLQPGTTCDGIIVFSRDSMTQERLRESAEIVFGRPVEPGELRILSMPGLLKRASSHEARKALILASKRGAAAPHAQELLDELLLPSVRDLCLGLSDVIAVYEDQVENTPDSTPQRTPLHTTQDVDHCAPLPEAHVVESEDGLQVVHGAFRLPSLSEEAGQDRNSSAL